jgi:predicted ATP-dependent endonuclease of OLD family
MLPTAIEISGFRSFGSKPVLIDSLKKLNFFVGQNNSGKSNVLRSITMLSSIRGPDPRLTPRSSDFAAGAENINVCLHFPNRLLREVFVKRSGQQHQGLEEIDDSKSFAFPFTVDRNNTFVVTDAQVHRFVLSTGIQEARFRQLVQQYLGLGADTLSQARHLMQSLDLENYLMNKVLFVPQIRTVHSISQYVDNVDQFIDSRHSIVFSGGQMIDLLFRLQHPSYDARADREKFNKIIQFLRDITQNETVSLEVPHDRSSILVNMDGKTLPLHNLGTGIEEILIMAAASLGFADKIVCIEEPELHIHPLLQKKLIQLLGQTDNLFLLTTHSSSLIDVDAGAIYNVRLVNGSSEITNPISPSETRSALHDLGYRPSDLLQTNSIVWVEGPSDRIYLKRWLSIAAPFLKEGIDYSVMFYGGRLLAHLSASEETVGEFIELLRLNRFSSIVIDSDKKSEQSEINQTKQRLVREIEATKGVVWVTTGREIENELQKDVFEAACAKINQPSGADLNDKFSDRLVRADDPAKQIDKIRLARAATTLTMSVPDSAVEPIQKLVEFIKSATLKSV